MEASQGNRVEDEERRKAMEKNAAKREATNQTALGSFCHLGFVLEAPDDHALFLFHEDDRIAVFSQTGATPESLRNECSKHLVVNHSSTLFASANSPA
jgi:hypothetical protein